MTNERSGGKPETPIDDETLRDLERTAVEVARLAGVEITDALGRTLAVQYKGSADPDARADKLKDPVSEVDRQVEVLIRARLTDRFPDHAIIGEEMDDRSGGAQGFAWAVDPVDGTTNFVNGFPLFAASVGVLHRGRPIVGALWCSATHALRTGVYHARRGGRLCFDGDPLQRAANPAVRRHLAGEPSVPSEPEDLPWEVRKTGSAAIECAFVAAGLLRVARFEQPNLWDVSAGIALVEAVGGAIRTFVAGKWLSFTGFAEGESGTARLGQWRQPLILGDPDAVDVLCRARS